jgi:hypothetical protein
MMVPGLVLKPTLLLVVGTENAGHQGEMYDMGLELWLKQESTRFASQKPSSTKNKDKEWSERCHYTVSMETPV